MVARLRESLTLVLLALLPFHALGVTVLTLAVAGPDHAPLGALALWKEALLAAVILLALTEILRSGRKKVFMFDRIDRALIVTVGALVFGTLFVGVPLKQAVYGIRYDLVPLAAFLVLRRVPWDEAFLRKLPFVLAGAVFVAVAYGLLTLVLPTSFFSVLGYSDLHSLYLPNAPVAPFQQVGGTALRRMQGAMSGPNQFGIWLACVMPVLLALPPRNRRVLAPIALLAVLLSFSRAAWIATAVVVLVHFWPTIRTLSARTVGIACTGLLVTILAATAFFPAVVLRGASSSDHLRRPAEALAVMALAPFGRGLGSAGPANNRVTDACVFLEEGSDPSWALPHPELCVFVGKKQIQPENACDCPLLPENWYLQLGVEGGWIAMIAFIVLLAFVIRRLWPMPPAFGMLAVAIAGMFLHAWEDAAVAYTSWILCAIAITSSSWDSASRR